MTKITCIACSGTGKNSQGGRCVPCGGAGRAISRDIEKPSTSFFESEPMEPDKMRIWKSLNTVNEKYLEPVIIDGKVLAAINPQHRMQLLTEQFGPCGQGWGWNFKERWSERFTSATTVFVRLSLWYMVGDTQYETGDQIGGTLVQGNPDDCYKSAVTDAIGKCAAALGLGADVYLGEYDGKLTPPPPPAMPAAEPAVTPKPRGKKTAEATAKMESIEPLPGQQEFPPEVMEPAATTQKPTPPPPVKPIQPIQPIQPVAAPVTPIAAPAAAMIDNEVPF